VQLTFQNGGNSYDFSVTYSDDVAVDLSSLDDGDIRVTSSSGFNQEARLVAVDASSNGTPRTATYRITAPGGTWDSTDNGSYSIFLQSNQVSDTSGDFAVAGLFGEFNVNMLKQIQHPRLAI
jgi:hypothetical protein